MLGALVIQHWDSVRQQSPFQHTFYYGYTNGTFGYLPTRQAFAEGGYEPHVTVFTPQIEDDLKTQVSRHLREMSDPFSRGATRANLSRQSPADSPKAIQQGWPELLAGRGGCT